MPTITTTVTSAAASGVVTTQTVTEATPEPSAESEGYVWDGIIESWTVKCPVAKLAAAIQFDTLLANAPFAPAFEGGGLKITGGSGVGSIRHGNLAGGGPEVKEVCITANANGHSYHLISDTSAFEIKQNSYRGSFACGAIDANTSFVTWTNTYQTKNAELTKGVLLGFIPLMEATWAGLEN